jgi:membrane associated rhomboid family serine protease
VPLPLRWQWKIDRLRERISGFFGGNQANARPRMCPACGTLVGTTATKCHVCGANVRFGMAAMSRSIGNILPANAPVTYAIVSLCCLMYGISMLLTIRMGSPLMPEGGGFSAIFGIGSVDEHALILLGNSVPLPYLIAEPWRLVTAIFLHASLLHIGFNMWVLMDIGPMVEEIYGSARYFFLFVLTGAIGYVASSAVGHFSVGASGGLLGLMGLLFSVTSQHADAMSQMIRRNLITWLIYIAIMGFMFTGTDNWAHGGGFVAGFLLGRILPDRQPSGAQERKHANTLGWATGIVVIACFALMMREFLQNR